jgi:hypothetical protein
VSANKPTVDGLTFVYDADGTLSGELRYWFGTLVGGQHCSLCDITHSRWRKRPDFRRCADRIGMPITFLHRDDLDEATMTIAGSLPVVLGQRGTETVVVLAAEELAALHGDVAAFEAALTGRIASLST